MGLTSAIVAAVGVAASLATTGYALSKGTPSLPAVIPPKAPPAPPPVPPPAPTPPTDADAGKGIADERRKRVERFSVQDTLLSSPLGGTGRDTPASKSLLGG